MLVFSLLSRSLCLKSCQMVVWWSTTCLLVIKLGRFGPKAILDNKKICRIKALLNGFQEPVIMDPADFPLMPPQCANPQWLQYLKELRDEQRPDSNLCKTYSRACRNMKTYPYVLQDVKDLVHVDGIGTGTVKKLEAKILGITSSARRPAASSSARKKPRGRAAAVPKPRLPLQESSQSDDQFKFWYLT
ncbi:hypothetical protein C8J56DRAFT_328256 [Mycena floridula]|nr:hypothetical protein C8J56DRAFT_328256 [Mycena floridula]